MKDREFGVGDAYPFTFRLERYGGAGGLVLTMSHVSEEARRFLEERKKTSEGLYIDMLEGSRGIVDGVSRFVETISKLAVIDLVEEAFADFGLNTRPVVEGWMSREQKKLRANTSPLSIRA